MRKQKKNQKSGGNPQIPSGRLPLRKKNHVHELIRTLRMLTDSGRQFNPADTLLSVVHVDDEVEARRRARQQFERADRNRRKSEFVHHAARGSRFRPEALFPCCCTRRQKQFHEIQLQRLHAEIDIHPACEEEMFPLIRERKVFPYRGLKGKKTGIRRCCLRFS